MIILNEKIWFPDVSLSDENGLLAIGGDLTSERLTLAYNSGIFPWYEQDQPILWWSPDPRMVLFPDEFIARKSLIKRIEKGGFKITYDQAFDQVIDQCATVPRDGQAGTWITIEMIEAYKKLHLLGIARSVEVWKNDELVGGLYGIDLPQKGIFCGESMFSKVSDASKIALYFLIQKLKESSYKMIDCQVYTDHLYTLGAKEISRKEFLNHLRFN